MAKTIVKSFKFRLQTSTAINAKLEDTLRLCRELYNASLQERRDAYKLNRISLNYYDQANQLKEIKQTNPEYKQVHSQISQDVLKRVDFAFQNFFRRIKTKKSKVGFPRFKGQNRYNSFTFTQSGFCLTGNKLKLSKIGTVKIKLSRKIIGKVKTCIIKREIDKWFVIFTVETAIEPLPKTREMVGLDAGIATFATLSDGTEIDNPRYAENLQKKLRVAQRNVSRKKKGGSNRKKAVLKLRKIHQKIKNCRLDFHHKTARYLVNNFDAICIEKLLVSNMIKNHNLARVISDVGWSAFFKILSDKVEETGRKLIKVNPAHTSQTCNQCGHCEKDNRKTQSNFDCVKCSHSDNADVNASKNILLAGLASLNLTNATRQ